VVQYRRRSVCAARRAVRRLGGQSAVQGGRVLRRLAIGQSAVAYLAAYGMKVDGLTSTRVRESFWIRQALS